MSRMDGRTSLILGAQDVLDLTAALQREIKHVERFQKFGARNEPWLTRLYVLRRRLSAAASRLERGRNGRSAAAA